jgi:hypothetical protein
VSVAPPAPATPTVGVGKWSFIVFSKKVGGMVTTRDDAGTYHTVFDIHENGRGPHVESTFRLAPDGTVASYESTGHHTIGSPVKEHFDLEGGVARWNGIEEKGQLQATAPTFFLPLAETMDLTPALIAALQAHGGKMALAPAGEARLEKSDETTVTVGGQAVHLQSYKLFGVDFRPVRLWYGDDGALFAAVAGYGGAVREGADEAVDQLVKRQNELDAKSDRAVVEELGKPAPSAGVAFTHARVLDIEGGTWKSDQTVLVVGTTIKAVGPARTIKVPADAQVIDLTGKSIVPGLWDMHAHFSEADGLLYMAAGVTSARDVGNRPDVLDEFKKSFDEERAAGPHLYRQGFIEGVGSQAASSEVTATNPDEAKKAVEFYAKRGYDGIKIYNSVPTELVPILAREAHARKMTVFGHIPVHMLAHEAVEQGYDGIEHINQVMLNFVATHETDTRNPTRFTLVGDKVAGLDLHSKPVLDFVALLKSHHTVIDPTLSAFEDMYIAKAGEVVPDWRAEASRMPATVQRGFLVPALDMTGKQELYAESWKKMLAFTKQMHDAGISVTTGTDGLSGLALVHEIELFVEAGFTPVDALRSATILPARTLKVAAKTGTIAPGKTADLFVVDGDPLADIHDIERGVLTVRGGRTYPCDALWKLRGVRPVEPR